MSFQEFCFYKREGLHFNLNLFKNRLGGLKYLLLYANDDEDRYETLVLDDLSDFFY